MKKLIYSLFYTTQKVVPIEFILDLKNHNFISILNAFRKDIISSGVSESIYYCKMMQKQTCFHVS